MIEKRGNAGRRVKGKRKRKRYRILRRLRIQLFLQVSVILCAVFYVKYGDSIRYYMDTVRELHKEAKRLVADTSEEDFGVGQGDAAYAGMAYAGDGTLISAWKGDGGACYISLSDMPQEVLDAVICVEDKRFYSHRGVDCMALLRAFFALVENRGKVTQGGSTVTMQLARTMYLTPTVSWQRKMEEIFIAWELEKRFSKEQLMEFYLNNIYFGNGYYGIGNASRGYFGKDIGELDLAQLIYLCAIPNNPTLYDPLINSENTEKRKVRILEQMQQDGYLSEEEFRAAASETVTIREMEEETVEKRDSVQTYTTHCAVRALMECSGFSFCYCFEDEEQRAVYEKEYEERYAECRKLLYTEGYRIETSFDLHLQELLQEALDTELGGSLETNREGVYAFQGAAVCIDNTTGFVIAMVGGRSQEFDFYPLNRGYQSFRQPGSSIKPLIVYTPAFERGYTPNSLVQDMPIAGGPRNATGNYEGTVTVRHAIEQSINTVAWKLFEELTPNVGLSYLNRMGFSKIMAEDYDLPSALGGFTVGVSPLEMASAYAAIENGGIFRNPTCITRILDRDGNVLYEPDLSGTRVYTWEAAELMGNVLEGVMENGTGTPVRLSDRFCAGKTGTTNDCKDSWFVGYTEEYTTSVWVGYDIPRKMEGLSGPAYSGYLWKAFMEAAYQGAPMP